MSIGGLRVGRLSEKRRSELLERARQALPTYDHLNSTVDPARHRSTLRTHHVDVGTGPPAFTAARAALQSWVPQRALGAEVTPDQPVALGETVLLVFRRGPLYVAVPNRVLAVVDEPRRYAYAYGSLPGHPERGEESFTVERLEDDTVRLTIRVDAEPATLVGRAAAPILRRVQDAALRRYRGAVAGHVARHVGTQPPAGPPPEA